jgi:hypothetical protein
MRAPLRYHRSRRRPRGLRAVAVSEREGATTDKQLAGARGRGLLRSARPTTPRLRLEDMARNGVEASDLFPPIFGMRTPERKLADAVVCAYNDWAFDFGRAAPNQLLAVAQLFPVDPGASTREVW